MLIGGHVHARGGIDRSVDNALAIGADVIQTHPSPPQMWKPLRIDEPIVDAYRRKAAAANLRQHWFHAVYLVNLAGHDSAMLKKSITSLAMYMDLAERLGAEGVIFHPGSHKGAGFASMLPQMASAVREVLARTDSPARLVIENSAGAGGCVGCSFDEVGALVDAVASDRVFACLDTAHCFASGYDIRTAEGIDATLRRFDETIGLDRLAVVHANDSRAPLGSNVDRHANIGEGEIGEAAFQLLAADARLREVPWILEVPGAGQGPDLEQVNRLRRLAGLQPATARSV
jgi:deoxyribonuclease-4